MFVGPDFLRGGDLPPVVILGSGPAGMSLAVALAELQISSLILEAGGTDFEPDIQDDYIGEVTGDTYFPLDVTRLRQYGGSSNHWSGLCRQLDAWDFDAVPELGIPAWPIKKSDLDPYLERANAILEIPKTIDHPIGDGILEPQFVSSPPVRFGEKYEPQVRSSNTMHVALRSAVTALKAEEGRIVEIDVVDANGDAHSLAPEFVVVACGGIENSRLLLWSNAVSSQRVVAQPEALGRYWMEHPHETVGNAAVTQTMHKNPLQSGLFFLSIDPEHLTGFGALNAAMRLQYPRRASSTDHLRSGLCSIAPELLGPANALAGTNAICGEPMTLVWEQAPDSQNRIELSQTVRDRFGTPGAHLYWRKTEQDYRTARVAFELIATHIVGRGAEIVRADPHLIAMGGYPSDGEIAGNHHMGGTRMSAAPSEGVVDADLRIHGLSNGYVAGSSVFTRVGHANPTLTIVQLSLRLADHLATRVRG